MWHLGGAEGVVECLWTTACMFMDERVWCWCVVCV